MLLFLFFRILNIKYTIITINTAPPTYESCVKYFRRTFQLDPNNIPRYIRTILYIISPVSVYSENFLKSMVAIPAGIDLSNDFNGDFIPILLIIIPRSVCITKNNRIVKTVKKLSGINMLFQKIRNAFNMPDKGNLSDNMEDDDSIQEKCNIVIGEMEIYLHTNIPAHMFTAAKHIITRYHERKAMLFANNPEHGQS